MKHIFIVWGVSFSWKNYTPGLKSSNETDLKYRVASTRTDLPRLALTLSQSLLVSISPPCRWSESLTIYLSRFIGIPPGVYTLVNQTYLTKHLNLFLSRSGHWQSTQGGCKLIWVASRPHLLHRLVSFLCNLIWKSNRRFFWTLILFLSESFPFHPSFDLLTHIPF